MTPDKKTEITQVFGTLKHVNEVEVIEIGLKEVTICTHVPLPVGTPYRFTLTSEGGSIDLKGHVSWCLMKQPIIKDHQKVISVFHAGIAIDPGRMGELQVFLADSMMITLKNRIFGNIDLTSQLKSEYSVKMDSGYEFQVTKIGLGGVKGVTKFCPEIESNYDMEMMLGEEKISFLGRVQQVEARDQRFFLKIHFINISQEHKKIIEKYLLKIRTESRPG